jgi:hypothetical protein
MEPPMVRMMFNLLVKTNLAIRMHSISTINILRGFCALGVVMLVASCHTKAPNDASSLLTLAKTNSIAIDTAQAGNFLFGLHKSGRLPGDSPNDVGQVTSDFIPLSLTNQLQYPISRVFHVTKTNDSSIYNYTVTKLSNGLPWQLQRAWKTDSKNKVIEEWPVR